MLLNDSEVYDALNMDGGGSTTLNTSPAGPAFSFDGTGFTSSASPERACSSTFTIATTSPQTVSGTRCDFTLPPPGPCYLRRNLSGRGPDPFNEEATKGC